MTNQPKIEVRQEGGQYLVAAIQYDDDFLVFAIGRGEAASRETAIQSAKRDLDNAMKRESHCLATEGDCW